MTTDSTATETNTTATTEAPETTTAEDKYLTSDDVKAISKHNYKWLISKSILFYEAQRSGNLTGSNTRVKWRADSFLDDHGMTEDGQRIDLSGGYYDAGDTIKFGFPLAYTMTILAWGGLEFYESYEKINELGRFSN